MSLLQGWHRGERVIHEKMSLTEPMATAYTSVKGEMPEQHREFHSTWLPFVPVATLDDQNRPWTSIFAGRSGQPGFISSPSWNRLDMDIRLWEGDPFWENSQLFDGKRMEIAGIGIEFSTRRRNKFAGFVFDIQQNGDTYKLKLQVDEALG
jgi:predicted pyridoxine 5'-phosphate oxidase superfamily flavin-nucleotide-binding protein